MSIKNVNLLNGFQVSTLCPIYGARSCVAVKQQEKNILVADTKNPAQAPLVFDMDEWNAFISSVKQGEFDYK